MKTRLTMRAALALGRPSLARGISRMRRTSRDILNGAGHEAGQGNVLTAKVLVALYLVAL
ncbi:hypothetical protein ABS772_13160 [Methylorubrum podarium]|uniref:Uncharacterized protein n=1 Tax=Methylorubrum podarium TaxID=200476 RepID=A0ABV1QNB3_9HYPH